MSSIVVSGDTSGAITIAAPAVAGTNTLTLPASTGTVALTGAAVTRAQLPAGSILQVVNAIYGTQTITSSTSYSDTGLSASITPSSATNKILVIVSQPVATVSDNTLQWKLLSGATTITTMTAAAASQYAGTVASCLSYTYLDSPATTSSVTYKTQFSSRDSGESVYVNLNSSSSSITLMEIAA